MRLVSKSVHLKFVVLLCLVLPASLLSGQAEGMTEDEKAVWQLEEDYWVYVKQSDLKAYRTLWDDRFVGWPSFSADPLGVEDIASWIPGLYQDPQQKFDYELNPKAVRGFGDIVAVHYLVREFSGCPLPPGSSCVKTRSASRTPGGEPEAPGESSRACLAWAAVSRSGSRQDGTKQAFHRNLEPVHSSET